MVISALPTSMKSVGISRPYFTAASTRSRMSADNSISLSERPRYFSASSATSARKAGMSTFLVGRPMA